MCGIWATAQSPLVSLSHEELSCSQAVRRAPLTGDHGEVSSKGEGRQRCNAAQHGQPDERRQQRRRVGLHQGLGRCLYLQCWELHGNAAGHIAISALGCCRRSAICGSGVADHVLPLGQDSQHVGKAHLDEDQVGNAEACGRQSGTSHAAAGGLSHLTGMAQVAARHAQDATCHM